MASVVYVASSTTQITAQTSSVVDVSTTNDVTEVIISNLQGPQGTPGQSGIVSVVAPITNTGTVGEAIVGINSSSADTANYVVQRDANGEFIAGAVTIDTTKTPTPAPGKLFWDGGGTVNLGLAGGNVDVALGENLVSYVTNAEATTLAVGEVVYVFGAAGDRPSVKRATNAAESASSKTLGIVAEAIGPNQIGFVVTRGIIQKLNLGSYTAGAPVYLGSTPGTFTSTKPVAPANLVSLGWVIRANNGNGQIYVNVQNGFELEELHNVLITSPTDNQALVYDSATQLWKNENQATAPGPATPTVEGIVYGLTDATGTTDNVALGISALDANTTGTENVAIGAHALELNTNNGNTAVGSYSLAFNTTGNYNLGFGTYTLYANTSGDNNVAVGNSALVSNTTGFRNVAIGPYSMIYNVDGDHNMALGEASLYSIVSGANNVAIGSQAGYNTTGSGNVFIGYQAGYSETGSNKLYIANNSTTSLITGDFSANTVTINGNLTATIDGGNA